MLHTHTIAAVGWRAFPSAVNNQKLHYGILYRTVLDSTVPVLASARRGSGKIGFPVTHPRYVQIRKNRKIAVQLVSRPPNGNNMSYNAALIRLLMCHRSQEVVSPHKHEA